MRDTDESACLPPVRCGLPHLIGAACLLVLAAPVGAATTISVDGLVQGYYSTAPNGPFGLTSGTFAGHNFATVGSFRNATDLSGYYASLIQFALPALPADAMVSKVTLTINAFTGYAGNISLHSYVTPSAALDPDRIDAGTDLGIIDPRGKTDIDVSWPVALDLGSLPAGWFVGFSFHAIADCGVRMEDSCFDFLGSQSGDGYPIPTLSVSYDVPVPPPPSGLVPEPAAWAMMLAGFGMIGGAMRRRFGGREAASNGLLPGLGKGDPQCAC